MNLANLEAIARVSGGMRIQVVSDGTDWQIDMPDKLTIGRGDSLAAALREAHLWLLNWHQEQQEDATMRLNLLREVGPS